MKAFGRRLEEVTTAEIVVQPRPAPVTPEVTDMGLRLRLRAKIMEQLDLGAVAEMPPEILRAELEPVIHQIAGQERPSSRRGTRHSSRRN